jgi:hypothetical protein
MIRSFSDVTFIFHATGYGHRFFRLGDLKAVVATRVVEAEVFSLV